MILIKRKFHFVSDMQAEPFPALPSIGFSHSSHYIFQFTSFVLAIKLSVLEWFRDFMFVPNQQRASWEHGMAGYMDVFHWNIHFVWRQMDTEKIYDQDPL